MFDGAHARVFRHEAEIQGFRLDRVSKALVRGAGSASGLESLEPRQRIHPLKAEALDPRALRLDAVRHEGPALRLPGRSGCLWRVQARQFHRMG